MSAHPRALTLRHERTPAEVQALHDLLLAALRAADADLILLPSEGRENAHGMLNLCCWLLGHPDGRAIEDVLRGLPLILEDAGVPIDPTVGPR